MTKLPQKLAALVCSITMISGLIQPTFAAEGFPDVSSDHWAYSYVNTAVDKGIFSGFPDGKFHPNDSMTYAQFISTMARAYYIIPEGTKSNPWYQVYVDILNQDDLLAGTQAETSIGAPISRYEMAQIVSNVLNHAGAPIDEAKVRQAKEGLADWSSIPVKYQEAVSRCVAAKVLSGMPDKTFSGGGTMTRAQACSVLVRVINYLDENVGQTVQAPSNADPAAVIKLINAERAKKGLNELKTLDGLTEAANARAADIAYGYIDERKDGSSWDSVFTSANISSKITVGAYDESMAGGPAKAEDVLTMLKNTDGPKDAMVNGDYTHIGVGYTYAPDGIQGLAHFWSILYAEDMSSKTLPGGFTPVPMDQLANRKSLQKKATDAQLAQAYSEALKIVTPLASLSREEQLRGIAKALRSRFDAGMQYSTSSDHYNDPYGYFIEGSASCAGCTRATGLCLNILGIPYEHVNEGEWSHQWCRVNVNGTYWICDAYGLYVGPEPAPYQHPYF